MNHVITKSATYSFKVPWTSGKWKWTRWSKAKVNAFGISIDAVWQCADYFLHRFVFHIISCLSNLHSNRRLSNAHSLSLSCRYSTFLNRSSLSLFQIFFFIHRETMCLHTRTTQFAALAIVLVGIFSQRVTMELSSSHHLPNETCCTLMKR